MAWLFTTFSSNSQELTGNIVYTTLNPPPPNTPFTWNGFISENTGGGGYSGGSVPAYNPSTGTFIFGYTQGTVAYTTSINAALSAAGTGIQVSGLKYSWQYFNQDYSRGTLTGNISVTNSAGATIQNYNYNMPQTTNGWTTMSGTQSFGTQYAPSTLGNLNVSFSGKDDRWWAGYYGPQIRDIDVRLQYTVAPPPIPNFSSWTKLADENYEFTLTKPAVVRYGANDTWDYKELQAGTYSCSNGAWGKDPLGGVYKRCELGLNNSSTPIPTPSSPTTNTTVVASEPPAVVTPTTVVSPTSNTSTTEVAQPVQAVSNTNNSTSPAPTVSSTASSTTTTPSATNPQPKVGEVAVSGSPAKIAPSMSQILSIVRNEQTRIGNLETSTVQQAVEQAQAASDKAQKESVSISSANMLQSQASAQAAVSMLSVGVSQSQNGNNQTNNNTNSNQNKTLSVSNSMITIKAPELENTTTEITKPKSLYSLSTSTTQVVFDDEMNTKKNSYKQNVYEITKLQNEEQTKLEGIKLTGVNPLLNAINGTQTIEPQNNDVPTNKSVINSKVQDNDAAKGGISLTAMTKQPLGFDSYFSVIPDVAFYAPKEVYRNQKVVDNVTVLRQLSTDRLHQEMVEQQYRK